MTREATTSICRHCPRLFAVANSVARLGILGRERVHYWRLIGWTVLRRPRLLPHAVTIAIYGYHFRLIADRIAAG